MSTTMMSSATTTSSSFTGIGKSKKGTTTTTMRRKPSSSSSSPATKCFAGKNNATNNINNNNESEEEYHQSETKTMAKKIVSATTALGLSLTMTQGALVDVAQAYEMSYGSNPSISELAGLQANPVTNARALLRNALPIDCKEIRQVQKALESISDDLRVPGVKFSGVEDSVNKSLKIVKNDANKIVDKTAPAKKDEVRQYLKDLGTELQDFQTIVANKDKQEVPVAQQKCLSLVTKIEEALVNEFPYQVPAPYDTTLPRLEGRATVEMEVKIKDNAVNPGGKLTIVLDGYNAPVSAGNFTDLIQKKFYDGMKIQRSDGFVVQSGKPENAPKGVDGYIDPATGKERTVPLEIMPESSFMKKKAPEYDFTFEENGMYREQPVLPFNAFGTLAMARREADNNSASSQFFFLLRESELTPSGTNILDGRYSIFGYVVDNQELLRDMKVDDEIVSMKIIRGAENLVKNERAPAPAPAEEQQQQAE
jgi:cyclophilin family peptidyl-prolyl cis-trans isomerase